jgi:membrane protease YdiL (CAAX protease family)
MKRFAIALIKVVGYFAALFTVMAVIVMPMRMIFGDQESVEVRLVILPLVSFLLIAALGEEWIFRGYPLAALSAVMGRGWANLLVALFFTAGHWGASGWNGLVTINILLSPLSMVRFVFLRVGFLPHGDSIFPGTAFTPSPAPS